MAIIIDGTNTPTLGGVGYGDGTELAFTGAGTSGQVLTSAGAGAPTWVSPSQVLTLISTQTATAAASVVWSSGITYNRYVLYGRNVYSGSGNPRLYLKINAISSNYDTGFFGVISSGVYVDTTGGATSVLILPQTSQTSTSMNNFILQMSGMSGTEQKSFVGSSFLHSAASGSRMAGTIGGNLVTTTAASSLTLSFDAGTLNGVFSLYGVTV